jgi:hypothetical protein
MSSGKYSLARLREGAVPHRMEKAISAGGTTKGATPSRMPAMPTRSPASDQKAGNSVSGNGIGQGGKSKVTISTENGVGGEVRSYGASPHPMQRVETISVARGATPSAMHKIATVGDLIKGATPALMPAIPVSPPAQNQNAGNGSADTATTQASGKPKEE